MVLILRKKEIIDLLEKINALEMKHKKHLDPGDTQQLENLRSDLSQCLDRKVKNKCRYFEHRFYEQGNKCRRLLARQLKKQQESRHVHNLLIEDKKIVETQAIATEFQRFYEALYSIQTPGPPLPRDMEKQRREEI